MASAFGGVTADQFTLAGGSVPALVGAILGQPDHGAVQQAIPDEARITVVLNQAMGDPRQHVATLVHELAHLLLGHLGAQARREIPDRHALPHHVRELEAEGVAFLVTAELGLDVDSAQYLAAYRPEDAPRVGQSHGVFAAGRLVRAIAGGYRPPRPASVAADHDAAHASADGGQGAGAKRPGC